MTFGARLAEAVDARGPLCVGLDPHQALLAEWGLTDDDVAGRRGAIEKALGEQVGGKLRG